MTLTRNRLISRYQLAEHLPLNIIHLSQSQFDLDHIFDQRLAISLKNDMMSNLRQR